MTGQNGGALLAELRPLRTGRGVTALRLDNAPLLRAALGADSGEAALVTLRAILDGLKGDKKLDALKVALGLHPDYRQDTLTDRRSHFAAHARVSIDTIENWENQLFPELAHAVARYRPTVAATPMLTSYQLTIREHRLTTVSWRSGSGEPGLREREMALGTWGWEPAETWQNPAKWTHAGLPLFFFQAPDYAARHDVHLMLDFEPLDLPFSTVELAGPDPLAFVSGQYGQPSIPWGVGHTHISVWSAVRPGWYYGVAWQWDDPLGGALKEPGFPWGESP